MANLCQPHDEYLEDAQRLRAEPCPRQAWGARCPSPGDGAPRHTRDKKRGLPLPPGLSERGGFHRAQLAQ